MIKSILISEIDIEASPKVRIKLCDATVTEYAVRYHKKRKMPPIVVFYEKGSDKFLLADGMHRLYGASEVGHDHIQAEVMEGGYKEAMEFALLANTQHGLPRTNEDKRLCIREALKMWPDYTDARISESCDVDDHTVADVRKEMVEAKEIENHEVRIAKSGAKVPASKPRKSEPAEPKESQPAAKIEPIGYVDNNGKPIPKNIQKYWQRSEEVKAAIASLTDLMRKVKNTMDDKDPMYAEVNHTSVLADLDRVRSNLKCAVPHAVCATCQGHPESQSGGCRLCMGRGLISKFRWDVMVPSEVKALTIAK